MVFLNTRVIVLGTRERTTQLTNVEDLDIVLEPTKILEYTIGNVTLTTSRKADHANDDLGSRIIGSRSSSAEVGSGKASAHTVSKTESGTETTLAVGRPTFADLGSIFENSSSTLVLRRRCEAEVMVWVGWSLL